MTLLELRTSLCQPCRGLRVAGDHVRAHAADTSGIGQHPFDEGAQLEQ